MNPDPRKTGKPRPITYEMDARDRAAVRKANAAIGYTTPSDGSPPKKRKKKPGK
jgi:hypothetical protein